MCARRYFRLKKAAPASGAPLALTSKIGQGNNMSLEVEAPPPLRVLVVDDQVDSAQSLAALLEAAGFVVATAFDGNEALSVAGEFRPDLVISDLEMPEMDGCELLARLRERLGHQSKVAFLCVSGSIEPHARSRCEEAGFHHFLQKPVGISELLELIRKSEVYGGKAA